MGGVKLKIMALTSFSTVAQKMALNTKHCCKRALNDKKVNLYSGSQLIRLRLSTFFIDSFTYIGLCIDIIWRHHFTRGMYGYEPSSHEMLINSFCETGALPLCYGATGVIDLTVTLGKK